MTMMETISSPANDRVRAWKRLQYRSDRKQQGLLLVEGVRLAEEALAAGWQPEVCLISDTGVSERAEKLARQCRSLGVECVLIGPRVLKTLAETVHSQGLILVMRLPDAGQRSESDAFPRSMEQPWLIIDGVRDPGNLGTLLRSAWAFGVQTVLLTKGSTDPFSGKALRASMGAAFRLDFDLDLSVTEAIDRVKWENRRLLVSVASGGEPPYDRNWTEPLALVVGSEAEGVSSEWLTAADAHLQVPLADDAESLNAAIAGSILLYELARQRRSGGR